MNGFGGWQRGRDGQAGRTNGEVVREAREEAQEAGDVRLGVAPPRIELNAPAQACRRERFRGDRLILPACLK